MFEEFSEIYTDQLKRRIERIIKNSKIDPEFYFNKFSADKGQRDQLSKEEFDRLVRSLYEKVTNAEVYLLFKHFDRGLKGFITKQEFVQQISQEVVKQALQLSIEDVIKPLATRVKKFNVNLNRLFMSYDSDKNNRLSAEELQKALKKEYQIELTDDEVVGIKTYFFNKYKTEQISRKAFLEVIGTKFERQHDVG